MSADAGSTMNTEAFQHCFRVALHDTDAAGVLFFAHLFRHAHDAYEAWMARLGFPLDAMIRGGDLALPLVHAEADYRRSMRHGDQVSVTLGVAELGAGSFTIDYRFHVDSGKLAATARTVHVCIQPGEAGPRPLPESLSVALALDHRFGQSSVA
jgi:1,4-dihydroxy-2-naphthoyl-CoA hydrolase